MQPPKVLFICPYLTPVLNLQISVNDHIVKNLKYPPAFTK